eukprot:TRINITY_DN38379_c0_g1_i1.p1 TRINITY_DN38379_c0_g1~~TRINITY_DN38379_c0_g1_i1.p1  ORF type:complete len:144 (-),score=25.44 TRINITY_DN38379_c0_g1_i1:489-920(-)
MLVKAGRASGHLLYKEPLCEAAKTLTVEALARTLMESAGSVSHVGAPEKLLDDGSKQLSLTRGEPWVRPSVHELAREGRSIALAGRHPARGQGRSADWASWVEAPVTRGQGRGSEYLLPAACSVLCHGGVVSKKEHEHCSFGG